MYVDLTDVLREPGGTNEKPIEIAPGVLDDIEVAEPITGRVRVTNARQTLVVKGQAEGAVTLQCARCLEPYAQPLELELEASAPLSFFRGLLVNAAPGDDDEEVEPDDELAAIFDANSLDVLELVRQAIVLQSPPKPLCSPDCPGLPEAAQYMSAPDDNRWESLKDWKDEKKE